MHTKLRWFTNGIETRQQLIFVSIIIDFADAVSVFSDDLAITIPVDRFDEERFVTIGIDVFGRIWVVVSMM
ncbi:MAG TPA: BrnT family toxin [Allocoleopsis sp.]